MLDGHSSGAGFAPCLNATNPGGGTGMFLPAYVAIAGRPPLFGLAPGGVYPANAVTGHCGALLPPRFTLTLMPGGNRAVCFLWHYPWGHPRRRLAGTVFPWSPDFPPPGFCARQRPSDRLDDGPLAP